MILDSNDGEGEYIEDCEVCCRPIEIYFKINHESIVLFQSKKMEGI